MSLLLAALLPAVLFPAQQTQPPVEPAPVTAPAAAAVIDAKAEALLAANAKAMFALKSYTAQGEMVITAPPAESRPQMRQYLSSKLTAVKPNLMRYDAWMLKKTGDGAPARTSETPMLTFVSNGTRLVRQNGNSYSESTQTTPDQMRTQAEPWTGFYTESGSIAAQMASRKEKGLLKALRYAGKETVDGVSCDVVTYTYDIPTGNEKETCEGKLFIGPDKLTRRRTETILVGNRPDFTRDVTLSNIRTNFATPPAATFAYTPPTGVKSQAEVEAARPKLLVAGTPAPDFAVEDINGKTVKLSDFRGKTVILDFWATWCGPCMMSMPSTNAAGKKFKDSNVVVVAVNVWDEKDKYKEWVPKNQAKYDSIQFLLDPHGRVGDVAKTLYNVSGIPTQYIIDTNGIIRSSLLGYDDDPKVLENAIAAAQKPMPQAVPQPSK